MNPIVNISMLKSGTHLLREIITQLTGLKFVEPKIAPGQNNYEDQNKLFFPENGYFSWHLFPYESATRALIENKCVCLYLVRNLFDQSLSIYDHFRLNIDAEIGRGRGVDDLFASVDRDKGLRYIVNGCALDGFEWRGVAHQCKHIETIFDSANKTNGLIISYEDLCLNKYSVIERIASHLGVVDYDGGKISQETSMNAMRASKVNKTHFNHGFAGRIFDRKYDNIRTLLATKTNSYPTFEGYEYLTKINALKALVSG